MYYLACWLQLIVLEAEEFNSCFMKTWNKTCIKLHTVIKIDLYSLLWLIWTTYVTWSFLLLDFLPNVWCCETDCQHDGKIFYGAQHQRYLQSNWWTEAVTFCFNYNNYKWDKNLKCMMSSPPPYICSFPPLGVANKKAMYPCWIGVWLWRSSMLIFSIVHLLFQLLSDAML